MRLKDYAPRVTIATNSYALASEELQKACLRSYRR